MTAAQLPEAYTSAVAFRKLHDTTELCDATLVSNDGVTLPVHKVVMASRSEYFKTTFYGKSYDNFGQEATDPDPSISLSCEERVLTAIKSLCFPNIKLPFEGRVLTAIKSFCYTDSCDDGFCDLVKSLVRRDEVGDYNEGVLLENEEMDELPSRSRFLVLLTVASDYFLLPGLTRMLWKRAYDIMRFKIPEAVTAIYREATKQGSEELRKLAWHSYWFSQRTSDHARVLDGETYGNIALNSILTIDEVDPNSDYAGLGLIYVAGCSETNVNGEYYGTRANSCAFDIEEVVYERVEEELSNRMIARKSLYIGPILVALTGRASGERSDASNESSDASDMGPDSSLSDFVVAPAFVAHVDRDWKADMEHSYCHTKSQVIPPTCFIFALEQTFRSS